MASHVFASGIRQLCAKRSCNLLPNLAAAKRCFTTTPAKRIDMDSMIVDSSSNMMITAYGPTGFTINDLKFVGSAFVLPNNHLRWNVESAADVTIESLSLLPNLDPPVEILILGTGDRIEFIPPPIREYLRNNGIALEVQDTRRACATFNFLSEEGRPIAAGLIPPSKQ